MVSADLVHVGTIVKPHGIRGEVIVVVHCDDEGVFAPGAELYCRQDSVDLGSRKILGLRGHRGMLIVEFEGVRDRDAAEGLRRVELFFEKDRLAPPADGEFYQYELIGARVVDEAGAEVGTVESVRADLSVETLEIRSGLVVFLLPFVEKYVVSVRRGEPVTVVVANHEELRRLND